MKSCCLDIPQSVNLSPHTAQGHTKRPKTRSLIHTHTHIQGFPGGSVVKNLPAMQMLQEMRFRSVGQEDPLEEGTATYSSILAWKLPGTEEPGGLQSMVLHRVK